MVILVFGGTGVLGSEVVRKLLQADEHVRAFVRDEQKARRMFGEHKLLEIYEADYTQLPQIKDAFKNVRKVFLTTVPTLFEKQMMVEEEIVRLANNANVEILVKVSGIGASLDAPSNSLLHRHALCEQIVRQSGVPFVILRPNLYYQNFTISDLQDIQEGKLIRSASYGKISHVDARDVAECAAKILVDATPHYLGCTYFITGPESLRYNKIAEKLSRIINKEVRYIGIDDYSYYVDLTRSGLSEQYKYMMVKLFQVSFEWIHLI